MWSPHAFESHVVELDGVRARVIDRGVIAGAKAHGREDPDDAAKDAADLAALSQP